MLALIATPIAAADRKPLLENALLNGEVSPATQKAIRSQLDDPQVASHALDDPKRTLNTMTALVIGSPEFQHR